MRKNSFIGKEVGNYRITTEINSGAYGSIYKAKHTHLKERIVAIKFLHTYMGSPKEREQFEQEAQFLARLEHAHILTLLDFGFSERQPYLVASYAPGGSLRDLLKRQAPLPLGKAITVLTQVGQALHYAQQQQIIHRDLKPENILFNAQGDALLADFGIATMLSTTSMKHLTTIGGTPAYMAPEQFKGIISKEGDQYALGCIAYELVTGHQPFTAPDALSMGFKHLTEQPVAPTRHNAQLPLAIEVAILKALAKERTERYTDVAAFLVALREPFTQSTILKAAPPTSSIQPTILASATVPAPAARAKEKQTSASKWHYIADRHDEALAVSEQAIRLNPKDANAYIDKGNALNGLRRYEEAIIACEQAIRLDPGDADAYTSKSIALSFLDRYKEALAACEQAIRLNPNDATAYFGKSNALKALGRQTDAQQAHEKSQQLENHALQDASAKLAQLNDILNRGKSS